MKRQEKPDIRAGSVLNCYVYLEKSKMTKALFLAFSCALLSACAVNTKVEERDTLGYKGSGGDVFGYGSPESAIQALLENENATMRSEDGWLIVSVKLNDSHEQWIFTPEKHFAYPSAIRRTIYEEDGQVMMNTEMDCGSEKSNCDKLMGQYIELNRQLIEKVDSET